MYIEQLRQFCLIVEIGTVAKAAILLRMSPGALSRSMQKLASDSKLELFVPHGRKILPTDTGLKFYEVAKQKYDNLNASLVNLRQKKTHPLNCALAPLKYLAPTSYKN